MASNIALQTQRIPTKASNWAVFFFAVHRLYIFVLPTRCLRLAYAVAVFSYAGTICLDLPTRAYAYQLFSDFAYAACVCCFCGLSVGLNSSHFAYAVGASVASWGCVFCTSGRRVSYHNNKTQLAISQQNTSSNTAYAEKDINHHPQMPTKSLRAQAKCLRQHFTRHTLHKLNLPTKKRCSIDFALHDQFIQRTPCCKHDEV